jgi:hypothetical protein
MSLERSSRKSDNDTFDDLLHLCWSHQECWDCLAQGPCSWCPTVSFCATQYTFLLLTPQTSTCVPNTSKIHILAPISNADICPLWSERWELRARCLGCHVSTITLLTCIISVCSTFAVIGLAALGVKGVRKFQRWKAQPGHGWRVWPLYRTGWWTGWRPRWLDVREQDSGDQRPLLGEA